MADNPSIVSFLKMKDYEMVNDHLGSGSFGKTVLIKDPFIDELFVAKKYEPAYPEMKRLFFDSFLREIKIMYKLNHPNVVRIFSYYPYPEHYTGYIVMEYIDGQRIDEFIQGYDFLNDGPSIDQVFEQLIDGFDYIETQGIVHRDIRATNILVDKQGVAKIIDFGLGKATVEEEVSPDSLRSQINRGGLETLPAEYYQKTYDSRTDIFYLGELFHRLLTEHNQMGWFAYEDIVEKMMQPKPENRFSSFAEVKDAIKQKCYGALSMTPAAKAICQAFSDELVSCIAKFKNEMKLITSPEVFEYRLKELVEKNCFDTVIHNNSAFVDTMVAGQYSYYPKHPVQSEVVINFYKWFITQIPYNKKLVLNNLVDRLAQLPVETHTDDLPF